MSNVNTARVSGEIIDVDFREGKTGTPFCNFVVRSVRDTKKGEKEELVSCLAFFEKAKDIAEAGEGSSVEVDGILSGDSYEGRDGKTRYGLKLMANTIKLSTAPRSSDNAKGGGGGQPFDY